MSTEFVFPDWLPREPAPPPPPVDDHRVEGLVNRFIAAKQEALFGAPDAFYRLEGGDALAAQPALARRLQDVRAATLDLARDDASALRSGRGSTPISTRRKTASAATSRRSARCGSARSSPSARP